MKDDITVEIVVKSSVQSKNVNSLSLVVLIILIHAMVLWACRTGIMILIWSRN